MPSGENPLPGGIIDYYLGADASAPVRLEIVDRTGRVVRSHTSAGASRDPDPAAYNRLCQRTPTAPRCALPLYWAAPAFTPSPKAGMHRFYWDLRYDPIEGTPPSETATGAVPGRTFFAATTPWAPPGTYTVRLTVDGRTYTQPLTLHLDPRVKTPAAGLARTAALSREMYDGAVAARAAWVQARAMSDALPVGDVLKARIDSVAPPPPRAGAAGPGGGGGGGAAVAGPPTLTSVRTAMIAAAMTMQTADVAPTARQVAAVTKARSDYNAVMARWKLLSALARP